MISHWTDSITIGKRVQSLKRFPTQIFLHWTLFLSNVGLKLLGSHITEHTLSFWNVFQLKSIPNLSNGHIIMNGTLIYRFWHKLSKLVKSVIKWLTDNWVAHFSNRLYYTAILILKVIYWILSIKRRIMILKFVNRT